MEVKGLTDLATQILEEVERERIEKFGETWKPSEGENRITVDTSREAREVNGKFGPAVSLPLLVNKKKVSWLINKKSPVLREIMELIKNDVYKMTIIRTGEGKATRYSVK